MWQQRSRHVQLGQLRCAGITPFSRDALSEVTAALGRDYLRSAMSWPRAGTQSITHCDLVSADTIWGLWNCYSVIRVDGVWWRRNENTNFDPRWWRYGHMKLLTFWCWMIVSNDPNGVTNSGFWLVSHPLCWPLIGCGAWLWSLWDGQHTGHWLLMASEIILSLCPLETENVR